MVHGTIFVAVVVLALICIVSIYGEVGSRAEFAEIEQMKTDACMQHAIQHNYSFVGFFGRKDVNYTTCGFFDRGQYIVRYLDWR